MGDKLLLTKCRLWQTKKFSFNSSQHFWVCMLNMSFKETGQRRPLGNNCVQHFRALLDILCWNFRTIYGGLGTSRNRCWRTGSPALCSLAESIPYNRLLCFLKILKFRLCWRKISPYSENSWTLYWKISHCFVSSDLVILLFLRGKNGSSIRY